METLQGNTSHYTETLTCTLGEVGDVFVVEDHRVLQPVSQSTHPRATHDAHQRQQCSLGQEPVRCGLAILKAVAAKLQWKHL